MIRPARAFAVALSLAALASPASAEIVRVVIQSRETLPGTFGAAGAYEMIRGEVHGELDPADPANAIITDIALAPRNGRGLVEYSATFAMTRPVDMSRASGVMIYDVPNRGFVIPTPLTGDPDGHVRLVSGWQGDLAPSPIQQTLVAPVARNADGTPITGPILQRFIDMPEGTRSLPIQGGLAGVVTWARPTPVSLSTDEASLIRRRSDDQPGEAVPADAWAFADCVDAPFPGEPDPASLCLRDGFDPAFAYELTYTGQDPIVLGIGFAAVRDINSFFRHAASSEAAPNPVEGGVRWTVAIGYSQSGNFLRSFVNLGFNTAPGGPVFDGIMPLIAARQVPLNLRFGVPGGAADRYEPGSEGVLWWGAHEDAARGLPERGLLSRCEAAGDCPRVFDVFGSAEFWGLRKSPDLVGSDAGGDIPAPDTVRRYYVASITHGGGAGGFPTDASALPAVPYCELPANPNPASHVIRALTGRLIDWVTTGREPPPSASPGLEDLVLPTSEAMGFPAIPGQPRPDGMANPLLVYDFGPGLNAADLSGTMDRQPPEITRVVPVLVPRVNADGNETAGIRPVQLRVPLGTYTGWNVRSGGYYGGTGCGFMGGYIPFATTRAEREASGDPRLSLEERYGDHAGFVAQVREAAAALVAEGFLLEEDAAAIIRQAEESGVLR